MTKTTEHFGRRRRKVDPASSTPSTTNVTALKPPKKKGSPAFLATPLAQAPGILSKLMLRLESAARFPSEGAYQRYVNQRLNERDWLWYHTLRSKGSEPGFPDVAAVLLPHLLFAELKKPGGEVSFTQQRWLDALAAMPGSLMWVFVLEPRDDRLVCDIAANRAVGIRVLGSASFAAVSIEDKDVLESCSNGKNSSPYLVQSGHGHASVVLDDTKTNKPLQFVIAQRMWGTDALSWSISGNPLDCRRENLARVPNNLVDSFLSGTFDNDLAQWYYPHGTTGTSGVNLSRLRKNDPPEYRAKIILPKNMGGTKIDIGTFPDLASACRARRASVENMLKSYPRAFVETVVHNR